ncbi:unnamed protein product [Pedinophyceae sp. YPF-701]|nr:unnamed protein product [Pedinophyceae sp. YPF-701]
MDPRGEEWSARLPSPHLIARSGPGCGAAVAVCVGRFLPAECGAGDAQLVVALADRINVYQGDPRGAGEGSAAVLVLSQATLGRVVEVARLKWNECHQGTVAQEHVGLDFLALLAESGHLSILSYSRTLARLLAVQRIDLGSPQSRRHLGSGPLRRRIVPHPDGTAFATAAAHDRVAIFPARALAAEPSAVGTPPGPFAEEHRAIYAPAARRDPGAPTVAANAGLAGTPAPPMPVPAFHPTGADGISAVNVLRLLGSGVGEHSPLESSLPSDRAEPQWTVLAAAFVDAGAAAGAGLAVVALLYVAVTRRFVGRLLRRGAGQTALEAAGSAELGGAVGTAMDLVALEGVCRGGVLCCGTEGVVVLHVTQRGLEVMQTLPWASFFGPLAPPPACEALAHTGTLHVSAACRLPRTGGAAAEDAEDYACALSNGTLWAVRVAAGTAAVPWRTKGLGQVVRLPADATRNVGATTGLVALPAGSDWRGGAPFVLLRDPGEVVSGEFLYITPPETATSAQRAGATHWQFVAQSIVAGALAGATDMVLADGGERGGTLAYVTCAGGGVGEGGGSLRSIAAAQEAGDAVTLATGLNFLTGLFALSAQASNAVVGVAFPDVTKVLAVTTSATPSGTQAIVQDATPRLRSGPLPAPCLLAASVGPTEWGVSAFVGPESAALVRTAGTGEDGAVEVRFAERISCAALEAATGTLVLVRQGRTLAVTPLLAAPVILPASIGASPYALVGGLSDALSRDERFDVVLIAATTAGDLVACGLPFRGACGARSMTFGRGVPWCLAECPNVHAIVVASRPDPDEPTLLAPSPPGIDRHNIKSHPIQGTPLASADEDMAEPAVEEAANELHRSEVGIDEPFVDPSRGSPPSPTGTLTPGRMGYHYHGYGGDRAMPWAPDVFGLDGEEPRRPDPAAWPVRAQVTMGHKRVTRQTSRPRRLIESIYTPEAKGTVTLLCPRTAAELCTLNLMAGECPTAVARFASPAQPDADAAAHDAPSDILVVGTSFSQDDLRRKPFQGVIGALGRLLLLRVSRDGAESQVGAIELLDCVLVPGRVLALAHGPMLPGRTKSWALETWGVMHAAIGRRVVTMWLGQGRDRLCVMRQEPTMQPFACLAASPTGHLARGSRQGVVSLGQPMPLGHDDADRPPSPRARERCRHWGFVPAGVVDVLVEGRGGRLLTIADGAGVLVTMSPAAGRWCCLESLAEAARRGSEGAADGSGGIAAGSGVGGAAESSMGAARASTELRNGHAVPLPERGVAKLELSDFAAAALRGTWEAAHPIPGARPSVAAKGMTAPLLTVADMDGMGVAAAASFHEQLQVLQAVRAALRASTCATTPVDAAARRSGQFGARATGAEASETATEASGDAAQGPGVAVDARVAPTAPGHGHLVPDAAVPLQGKPLRLCGGVLAQRQPRATPHATEDATPAHRHGITALCAGGQLRSLHVLTPGEYVCLRALEVAAAEHRALAPLSGGPRSTLPGPLPSRLAHAASQGGVEWSLAKLTSGGSFGVVDGDLLGEAAKLPSHEQLHICASAVRVLLGDGGGAEGGSSSSATAGDAPPLAGTMLRALHLMTSSTA